MERQVVSRRAVLMVPLLEVTATQPSGPAALRPLSILTRLVTANLKLKQSPADRKPATVPAQRRVAKSMLYFGPVQPPVLLISIQLPCLKLTLIHRWKGSVADSKLVSDRVVVRMHCSGLERRQAQWI